MGIMFDERFDRLRGPEQPALDIVGAGATEGTVFRILPKELSFPHNLGVVIVEPLLRGPLPKAMESPVLSVEEAISAPNEERPHLDIPALMPREPDSDYWDRVGN